MNGSTRLSSTCPKKNSKKYKNCEESNNSMTPEAKVKAKVRKLLDGLRIYYFFPATHGYGRSGVPDIIGCFMGLFVAIECKAGKGQLTGLQELELTKIQAAGGFTFVAREDNIDELKEKLTCLIQELLPSD
jgi:hypothetical protein